MMLGIGDASPNFSGMGMIELLRCMFDIMLKTCSVDDRAMDPTSNLCKEM
jgi:hypothetical protein